MRSSGKVLIVTAEIAQILIQNIQKNNYIKCSFCAHVHCNLNVIEMLLFILQV